MGVVYRLTGDWKNVLKLIVPYLITVSAFQLCGILLLGLSAADLGGDLNSLQELVVSVFGAAGTFLVVWLFRKYADHADFGSLGLRQLQYKDVFYGVLTGFLIMFTGFVLLWVSGEISYLGSSLVVHDFALNLLFFIAVAFTEELLMRGYILTNLMASMNKYLALAVSSLLFSLMHIGNANYGWFPALELFTAGFMLGLSYIYTRNLWFPIALHFSWNFFQGTVFGFNVSGKHVYGIISQLRYQDTIWNGGAFGFEGSVLSMVLQLIAIACIYLLFRKRGLAALN